MQFQSKLSKHEEMVLRSLKDGASIYFLKAMPPWIPKSGWFLHFKDKKDMDVTRPVESLLHRGRIRKTGVRNNEIELMPERTDRTDELPPF
jgi:hypothetical protein